MLKQYIKQAIEQLRENTLVSVISIAGTALAIAVILVMVLVFQINSAGYAPETHRGRMLFVNGTRVTQKDGSSNQGAMSVRVARECFYSLREPEAVSVFYENDSRPLSLPDKRRFEEYKVTHADAGFWRVFDYTFIEGQPFTEADFHSAIPRMVLTEGVARALFGGESAVGRTVVMDFVNYTVCGVVREAASPLMTSHFEACVPYSCDESLMTPSSSVYGGNTGPLNAVMLARSSGDFGKIRDELERRTAQYNAAQTDFTVDFMNCPFSQLEQAMGASAWRKVDWSDYLVDRGAFLLFLLIVPALNLTGVVQSSVQKRKEEIGVRKAFGATGGDVMRQVLSENLVLTCIGGVIGIGLSLLLLVLCKSFVLDESVTLTPAMLFRPGLFLAALLLTFLLNGLSAIIPAWRTMRSPIVDSLRGAEQI